MRRARSKHPLTLALAATTLTATLLLLLPTSRADIIPLGQAQQAGIIQDDFLWNDEIIDGPAPNMAFIGRRRYVYSEEMLRSQIQQALQQNRATGTDPWAWRDTVENQLVGIGANAAYLMRQQLPTADGYQRDALQVALFRLDNPGLYPNDLLRSWADRFHNLPGQDHPPSRFYRVLDIRNLVGLRELFPHHLFYTVEFPAQKTRTVVALASDAMVQPINDDASLTRFIRNEAPPQFTQVGKERVAAAATLLAAARSTNLYQPERLQVDGTPPTFTITLNAPGLHQTLTATFAPEGILQTLATGQQKIEPKPTAPIVVPTNVAPPPSMPE